MLNSNLAMQGAYFLATLAKVNPTSHIVRALCLRSGLEKRITTRKARYEVGQQDKVLATLADLPSSCEVEDEAA